MKVEDERKQIETRKVHSFLPNGQQNEAPVFITRRERRRELEGGGRGVVVMATTPVNKRLEGRETREEDR